MIIKITGVAHGIHNKLNLKKEHRKYIPEYFEIEIDTSKIKERAPNTIKQSKK